MNVQFQGMLLTQKSFNSKRGEKFQLGFLDMATGEQLTVSSDVKVDQRFMLTPAKFDLEIIIRPWSKDGRSGVVIEATNIVGSLLNPKQKGGEN